MPQPAFRGDPYRVLDVSREATDAQVKRRWRELAREHHPDRAVDPAGARRSTARMARINAAYDLLRDPDRRARYDADTPGRAAPFTTRATHRPGPSRARGAADERSGPPPGPPTRPVTARFDTTARFMRRNAVTSEGVAPLSGHSPISSRDLRESPEERRASTPNGPVHRRTARVRVTAPSLEEARATELEFGKFRGRTLGQIEAFEPTYIDWIASTITRDRDLVQCARVIRADLDRRGVERRLRDQGSRTGDRATSGSL